jgi:mRNA interferase RelE/StbE
MNYTIEILRSAQKQLGKVDRQDQTRIISAIRELADDPRPQGSKKLTGRPAWRICVGAYRVIYEIHDKRTIVLVVAIGHRKDVYRE